MADLGKLELNAELEFNFQTGKIELSQVKQAIAQAQEEIAKASAKIPNKLSAQPQAHFPFAKEGSYFPGSYPPGVNPDKVSAMHAAAQEWVITDPTKMAPEYQKPEHKGGLVPDWKKEFLFPLQNQAKYDLANLQPFEKNDPFAPIYGQLSKSFSKMVPKTYEGGYTDVHLANFDQGIESAKKFYKGDEKKLKTINDLSEKAGKINFFAGSAASTGETFSTQRPESRFTMSSGEVSAGLKRLFPKVIKATDGLLDALVDQILKDIKDMKATALSVATGGGGKKGTIIKTAVAGGFPEKEPIRNPLEGVSTANMGFTYRRQPSSLKADTGKIKEKLKMEEITSEMTEAMTRGLQENIAKNIKTGAEEGKAAITRNLTQAAEVSKVIFGGFKNFLGTVFDKLIQGAALMPTVLAGALGAVAALVGGIFKLAMFPVVKMIDTIKMGLKEAFENGPLYANYLYRAAAPLSLMTGSLKTSIKDVQKALVSTLGTSMLMPAEAAKLAVNYTRITKSAKGLPEYQQALSVLMAQTGEQVAGIDDMIMGWAESFGIDIPSGAARITKEMSAIMQLTGSTANEIRPIAMWLMPTFAAATGDAAENFRMMLSLAGGLAQRGVVAPIMMRTIQGLMTLLETPPGKMMGLFAQTGINLFSGPGSKEFDGYITTSGTKMKALVVLQRELAQKLTSGSISQKEFVEQNDKITQALQKQETIAESVHKTYMKMGLVAKEPKEQLKELLKLKKDEAALTEFVSMIPGSSKATFYQFLNEIDKALYHQGILSKDTLKIAQQIGIAVDVASLNARTKLSASFGGFWDVMWEKLGEPVAVPLFDSLSAVWVKFTNFITNSPIIAKLSNVFASIGETLVGPLMTDFGSLITQSLDGGDITALSRSIEEKLNRIVSISTELWNKFFSPFAKIFYNVFTESWSMISGFLLKQIVWLGTLFGAALSVSIGGMLGEIKGSGILQDSLRGIGSNMVNYGSKRIGEMTTPTPGTGTGTTSQQLNELFTGFTEIGVAGRYAAKRLMDFGDAVVEPMKTIGTNWRDAWPKAVGAKADYGADTGMVSTFGASATNGIDILKKMMQVEREQQGLLYNKLLGEYAPTLDSTKLSSSFDAQFKQFGLLSDTVVAAVGTTQQKIEDLKNRLTKLNEQFAAQSVAW
jgi:hypothetical protein